jgi:hypothetical protein
MQTIELCPLSVDCSTSIPWLHSSGNSSHIPTKLSKSKCLLNNIRVYRNSVRTSRETQCVSATKPNRLMQFGETVVVYCENHTEHRYSSYLIWNSSCLLWELYGTHRYSSYLTWNSRCLLWEPYETHRYSSYLTWNSSCLLWEPYETHRYSSYLTWNSSCLLWEPYETHRHSSYLTWNSRCLLWEPHGTHKYTLCAECRVSVI